ncbi:MAG TPA: PHB depolymerase family esterase [Thermoanaerobaculia bacterium]|nr:PHB depolymerase family esterase [Thermoanaerobaculia bacterium]
MFALGFMILATLVPGDHRITLGERGYIVHVPPGAGAKPLPVVINLHGGGGNAENQQRYSGMDRVADREHFLVVYPDGTGRLKRMLTWNAGTCCGASVMQQVDDVGFIRAVIDDVAKRIPIDRKRVFATGMSNGAMMSYRLAAEAPDLVAAIAPVAGSMVLARFHPTKPISIMHIHSVDDPRALYNGGLGPPFPMTNNRIEHPPVEQQLAKWIAYDGCRATPTVARRLSGEGNTATKLVYAPCTSGAQIVLWKLTGSGHVWPGSSKNFERLLGKPTHLFDASEEIWSFFSRTKPR